MHLEEVEVTEEVDNKEDKEVIIKATDNKEIEIIEIKIMMIKMIIEEVEDIEIIIIIIHVHINQIIIIKEDKTIEIEMMIEKEVVIEIIIIILEARDLEEVEEEIEKKLFYI